jgi:hypothetical protein
MTRSRAGELWTRGRTVSVAGMGESLLQQQLDEVRALLRLARDLFGAQPVSPPESIGPVSEPHEKLIGP